MRKLLLFFACSLLSLAVSSQTADDYLSKAITKLNEGNCESAQKFYNVYKSLSGETSSAVEVAIIDCEKSNKPRNFRIGDDAEDLVGSSGFKIAYLDDSGKHGFAIKYVGAQRGPTNEPPSRNDCKLMYNHRTALGLFGEYWTGERNWWGYYTFDFSTGKERAREFGKGGHNANAISVKRF